MHDIRLAVALIGFLSVATFLLVVRLLRKRTPRQQTLFALAVVVGIFAYVETVWDQLWIVQWIPLPSVIVLSNWFPILLAALGASVWLRTAKDGPRSLFVMGIVLAAAVGSLLYFIPGEAPHLFWSWMCVVVVIPPSLSGMNQLQVWAAFMARRSIQGTGPIKRNSAAR